MHVPVADLLHRPGETRPLRRTLARAEAASDLGAGDLDDGASWSDTLRGSVEIDLHLDSVVEGILVRGEVRFALGLACSRCLEPVEEAAASGVVELYRERGHEDAEPGYEIVDAAIDLGSLLRDTIAMALPVRPLCAADCRGLCVVCGANRNVADCGHDRETALDPRWTPLMDLKLPPG